MMRKEERNGGEREKRAVEVPPAFSKKHVKKRKIEFVSVVGVALIIDVFIWVLLKKQESIDVVLTILGAVFTLFCYLFVKQESTKKILQEDQSIKMKVCQIAATGIAWLCFCILCGTTVVAAGTAFRKIFLIESEQEKIQEESAQKQTTMEEVHLLRNSKVFDWAEDIYISKLSDYYDGETEKLSDDQEVFYRYQLLTEYLDLRKLPIAKEEENNIKNYENFTSKANDYYELYNIAKMRYGEDIQVQLLDDSKEARENANKWHETSINEYLIGVTIMDIENIKIKQKNKNSYNVEVYESALKWYILAYRQAIAEKVNDYEVGVANMKRSLDAINNTYLDLKKSEDADSSQKANIMLQVLKYELKAERIELLEGVK